jgi:prepilin-type N-terminal cleavage/methylation domain-containing protein
MFNLKFKKNNEKKKPNTQAGMTYVELIVVLSIFAIMSSIVLFNYNGFQAKVDIKNLANDIALQVVQAQKSAMAGELPPALQMPYVSSNWKPSYGVYFDSKNPTSFIYFVDLGQTKSYDGGTICPGNDCLDQLNINKGNKISQIIAFYPSSQTSLQDLSVTFTRPDSGATLTSVGAGLGNVSYVQVNITSSDSTTSANVQIYPSGRIQIN